MGEGGVRETVFEYDYDSDGRPISRREYFINSETGERMQKSEESYTYDDKGNVVLVENKHKNGDGEYTQTIKIEYAYVANPCFWTLQMQRLSRPSHHSGQWGTFA